MKRAALAAALLGALAAAGAACAGPVTLREQVGMTGGTVTLGDLFEGAGSASSVVAARVQPGANIVMDAARVQMLARANGLEWDNVQGMRRIIVHAQPKAAAERAVLTYARNINTGEIVKPEDLTWGKAVGAPADAPSDPDAIIGKAARRPLREGGSVAMHDVASPQLIKAGDVVAVAYEDGGVRLVLQAKAMGGASLGDPVSLMNPASKKLIQALTTGVDEAVIGPAAEQVKAAALQVASLR